MFDYI